VTFFEPQT